MVKIVWVMTERTRSRIQMAKMSSLCRVAGQTLRDGMRTWVNLRDKVRSSVTLMLNLH